MKFGPLNRFTAKTPHKRPPKVLQFGAGNFLRGFADWMVDVLNEATDFDAGVICVKPTAKGNYHQLEQQDGLYHVLTNGIQRGEPVSELRMIHCIQRIINPYADWEAYLRAAEIDSLRFIVSNTTEAGIRFKPEKLNWDQSPQEFPAKLTLWLYRRWQHFEGAPNSGCIHLPCELIEDNGEHLKQSILMYSDHWALEKGFKQWISDHNHFCNTLVDRIVPGHPKEQMAGISEKIGFDDKLVVAAEPYHLWAISASESVQKELPFHKTNLNVVFTEDLASYRQLKVRILNGAHTLMVPLGYLKGIETVQEAVEDGDLGTFINKTLHDEIRPTLDFSEEQLKNYINETMDRFKNPFLKHRLLDIALNSISKFKVRLLPSLLAYHQQKGHCPDGIVTAMAALFYFYKGQHQNVKIPLKDGPEVLSFFKEVWSQWEVDRDTERLIADLLGKQAFWGMDLNTVSGLPQVLNDKLTQAIQQYGQ